MGDMPSGKSAKQKAIEGRRAKVAELLLAERPYRAMAAVLEVSRGTIENDVKAIREEWRTAKLDSLEAHRDQVRAQLTRLYRSAALLAHGSPPNLKAVDECRKLLADIRKLDGLDRPEEVHVRGQVTLGANPEMLRELLVVAKQHAAGLTPTGVEHVGELVEG